MPAWPPLKTPCLQLKCGQTLWRLQKAWWCLFQSNACLLSVHSFSLNAANGLVYLTCLCLNWSSIRLAHRSSTRVWQTPPSFFDISFNVRQSAPIWKFHSWKSSFDWVINGMIKSQCLISLSNNLLASLGFGWWECGCGQTIFAASMTSPHLLIASFHSCISSGVSPSSDLGGAFVVAVGALALGCWNTCCMRLGCKLWFAAVAAAAAVAGGSCRHGCGIAAGASGCTCAHELIEEVDGGPEWMT